MAKLPFDVMKRKLIERPFMGLPWEDAVRRGEDVCHGEGYFSPCRRESYLKYQSQVRHSEERIYVSILVLSQSRLLSHNSQACKFFPNTQQSIYIFRNK